MRRADRIALMNTCGKRRPGSPVRSLNSESSQSESIISWTGEEFGNLQKLVVSNKSQRTFEYRIIGLCESSVRTIRNQLEWSDLVKFSGVKLEQESRSELGTKPEWTLTLKIPEQSGGMGILVSNMLLSMNLEVQLIYLTCSAGLTDIQSWWKLKGQVSH